MKPSIDTKAPPDHRHMHKNAKREAMLEGMLALSGCLGAALHFALFVAVLAHAYNTTSHRSPLHCTLQTAMPRLSTKTVCY
jgi:hypothetical protein